MTDAGRTGQPASIRRATPADFPVIGELACRTWRVSFPGIITEAQIEYMLAQRYTSEALGAAVASGQLTFELLFVEGAARAFAAHGPTQDPSELKLQQLYVLPEFQGQGLGGLLLDHVETLARSLGRQRLVLTVNRHNEAAKAVYERRGFRVREEVQVEIGQGFIMDDFVMEKPLPVSSALPPGRDPASMPA